VPPDLINAYKATDYKIPELDLVIKIGQINQKLDEILKKHNANTYAFITAWNPYSNSTTDEQNKSNNQRLFVDLKDFKVYSGSGEGEDKTWAPEESFFTIGISRQEANKLGQKYEQNAIVFGEYQKEAELIILNSL
jgi:hypothetical protein